MDYQVSARKWRPQNFEEVIGQKHVTTSLANAIRLDRIAQAYLFSGIRGVGKTSLARILAKAVNCKKEGHSVPCNQCSLCREITAGRSVDVVEIDGASNTGVDDVRELRENVKYLPLQARYKVYIIDEVHMLSNAAFNALLKTLEEPPPHLIFILATTESHKIPETILSRCQHFAFRRMTVSEIVEQLRLVIEARQIQFTERGLNLIARVAEGSMRDALSLIDQAISYGGESVTDEDLFILLGRMDGLTFHRLVEAIHNKDARTALFVANEITDQGCDLRQFLRDWLEHLRHIIIAQNIPEPDACFDLPQEETEEIKKEAALFSLEAMQRLFSLFARLLSEIRNAPQPKLLFEVALMKAILLADTQSIESVIEKLNAFSEGNTQPSDTSETIQKTPKPVTKPRFSSPNRSIAAEIQPLKTTQNPPPFSTQAEDEAVIPNGEVGWQKVLSLIKDKRPSVGSYLQEGRLESFDEKEIKLLFPGNSSFLIQLIQKDETQIWLKSLLKKLLHRDITLTLLEQKKEEPPKPATKKQEPINLDDQKKNEDAGQALIQEVLKIMGGSVIETKRTLDD